MGNTDPHQLVEESEERQDVCSSQSSSHMWLCLCERTVYERTVRVQRIERLPVDTRLLQETNCKKVVLSSCHLFSVDPQDGWTKGVSWDHEASGQSVEQSVGQEIERRQLR